MITMRARVQKYVGMPQSNEKNNWQIAASQRTVMQKTAAPAWTWFPDQIPVWTTRPSTFVKPQSKNVLPTTHAHPSLDSENVSPTHANPSLDTVTPQSEKSVAPMNCALDMAVSPISMQPTLMAPIIQNAQQNVAVAKVTSRNGPAQASGSVHPGKLSHKGRVEQSRGNEKLKTAEGTIMMNGKPFTHGLPGLPFGHAFYKLEMASFGKNDEIKPRPLVIVFNGIQIWPGFFEFEGTLKPMCVHVLYLIDPADSWYLTDLNAKVPKQSQPASIDAVKRNVEFIKRIIAKVPYTHISTMGVSMGGFAAILYGALLGASHVLAFDPQVFVDKSTKVNLGDRRFETELECLHVPYHGSMPYQNLPRLLLTMEKLPVMTVVCGTRNANVHCVVRPACAARFDEKYSQPGCVLLIDELHTLMLKRELPNANLQITWLPTACHDSARKLKENGMQYQRFMSKALAVLHPEKVK